MNVDRVGAAVAQRLREVDEEGAAVALVFQRRLAQQDLVDLERGIELELDAGAVLQHLEADGVRSADEFLVRIDAEVEMVEEQIVVGAIGAVRAAEKVRSGLVL